VGKILQETVDITAMIFMIIMFSGVFGFVLADQQLPKAFTEAVIGANIQRWQFMMLAVFLIFILGFFMGSAAITLIVTPILIPLLITYKYSLIHFGVIQCAILETSFLTPPVGTVLYIIARVCKLRLEEVIKGVWPFIIIIYIATIIITFVPQLSLFLVKGGR
jgi:C4-dicarboxylate transporter DctM subunit